MQAYTCTGWEQNKKTKPSINWWLWLPNDLRAVSDAGLFRKRL